MNSSAIEISNLVVGYKDQPVLSDVNLMLKHGEATAMVGRNGAGKSTLIKAVIGRLKPMAGYIRIEGKVSNEFSRKELAYRIASVTTEPNMAGGLRLHELVALGRTPYTGRLGILGEEDRRKIEAALATMGLQHKRESFVAELSDGERQKGMIARGLVQDTPILIMDEPCSFLDVAARLEMISLLKELARERNIAVLFSTHEVTEALKNADRLWVVGKGSVKEGTPSELIEGGEIEKIFETDKIKFDRDTIDFRLR